MMSCNEVELNNLKHVTADWSNPIYSRFTTTPFQPPHPFILPFRTVWLQPYPGLTMEEVAGCVSFKTCTRYSQSY